MSFVCFVFFVEEDVALTCIFKNIFQLSANRFQLLIDISVLTITKGEGYYEPRPEIVFPQDFLNLLVYLVFLGGVADVTSNGQQNDVWMKEIPFLDFLLGSYPLDTKVADVRGVCYLESINV